MTNDSLLDSTIAEIADELVSSLCRDLAHENKFVRKSSLQKLRSHLLIKQTEELPHSFDVVFKDVLRCFSDPSEACREQAISLFIDVLAKIASAEPYLTFVIAVLVKRVGLDESREPTEEIRLLLMRFFSSVLIKSKNCNLLPHLDDLNKILCKGLLDNFSDVKLASADCTKILATSIPKQFHVQSESYLKALIPGAVHKHNKVRAAFISTIGKGLIYFLPAYFLFLVYK
jgi:hypothetical protein